ncbi:MAG: type II secretion system protein M [Burkholderiales bacterium]
MKTRLRMLWLSRSPRERAIVATLAVLLGIAAYAVLVQTAAKERARLNTSVTALAAQATRLERQATEFERLRAVPAISISQTDLRTLVQSQADAAALSHALVRIDVQDANQVTVVFGAVAFADWHNWIAGLASQHVRLDTCRIEALSTPGLVSVTATLVRARSI